MELPHHPVPKPSFKRRKPKRSKRNDFSPSVRKQIRSRDGELCRVCEAERANQIHHVYPRSRGGRGVYTNGLSICNVCHAEIHADNELMKDWQEIFEQRYGSDYYKDQWD
nr:hypothetical protein 19 [Bacillales bacterium]